jgi:hypothetical protein
MTEHHKSLGTIGCAVMCTTILVNAHCSLAEATDETASPRPAPKTLDLSGLVCFWDFQEVGGQLRRSRGPHDYPLREQFGKISRVRDGVWGPYSARIEPRQWLSIERGDCPALDVHGAGARYTILAWIKRDSERLWQYIAGVWNEAEAERQYALFVNGSRKTDYHTFTRTKADCQAHAYMSVEGGKTPGNFACFSYATGATRLEQDRWYFLAATYDQHSLKVYVDGKLDALINCNPFVYLDKPIFDGGKDGANFTVAQRAIPEWKGYPNTPYPDEGQGFSGQIGGLAVYNTALSAEQIATIHAAVEARKQGND